MSAATRQEIAQAATVPGVVNCTPRYRQSLKPGDEFVKLGQRVRASNGFGYIDTWQVWLALPQDIGAAEKWIDDHLDALVAALNDARVFLRDVETVTPAELVLGAVAVNGLILEGAREG